MTWKTEVCIGNRNIIYGANGAADIFKHSEEQKILEEILLRVKILPSYLKSAAAADKKFINEAVLPPFVDLYTRWPDGYKLLMKNNFNIGVVKENDEELFKIYAAYIGKNRAVISAMFVLNGQPESSMIFINGTGKFSASFLNKDIYRGVMRMIDNFSVKDGKNKCRSLSGYLDAQFKEKLSRIADNYMERLNKAEAEFDKWVQENGSDNREKTYNVLVNIMDTHKCWAYKKFTTEDEKISSYPFKYCLFYPHNAEELISNGLAFYFGSPEEKKRLKEFDPALYILIEKAVIPQVKKAVFIKK